MKARLFLLCVVVWAHICIAQSAATVPTVVPIAKEPSHHLVFENEYVRVFKVEVPPHAETLYHKHDVDYVFVTLGDSDVESVRVGEPPVRLQLKDGDTRFTKGGFAHKAVNNSDKPFVNVTVELKRKDDLTAPHGEGGGCLGLACDFAIFTTQHTRCRQLTTAGSGTGFGVAAEAKRLVIPITTLYFGRAKEVLNPGEIRWTTGPLQFEMAEVRPRVVVCEFAGEDEDFLKNTF